MPASSTLNIAYNYMIFCKLDNEDLVLKLKKHLPILYVTDFERRTVPATNHLHTCLHKVRVHVQLYIRDQ
jgi:hypothetical protein